MGFFSLFDTPASQPNLTSLRLTSPSDILSQFLSQSGQVGNLNNLAQTLNADENRGVQQQLSAVDPNLMGSLSQFGANTSSLLKGQIPQDVLDQISRSSAYQSLAGGFGGSGMAHALTARDLGLTSLQLQNQGAGNLGQQFGFDQALTPGRATAASMLLSPTSIQSADYAQDQYNNSITNQNKIIDWKNSQLQSPFQQIVNGALGNTFSSVLNAPANFLNSYTGGGAWTGDSGTGGGQSSGGGGGSGGLLAGLLGGGGGAGMGGLLALI